MIRLLNTRLWTLSVLIVLIVTAPARAQDTVPRPAPQPPAADTMRKFISPRAAFIRSMLIPGWGQFSVGAEKRAVVFIGLQSASWFMLIKTLKKIGDARDIESERIGFVSDTLHALMARDTAQARLLGDPIEFQRRIDEDTTVTGIRNVLNARKEQRQDWVTFTIFITMASAADAFVAAHLADFPGRISAEPRANGALQFKMTMPAPRR